jgi:hypothetical protein
MKHMHTNKQHRGEAKLTCGKEPLSFSLYAKICLQLLKNGSSGSRFAHAYLTMTWNLICRANNTANILFEHLSCCEDAIGVKFAKSKTDQTGDGPKDARHVYANPLIPEISVPLALGIYFLCTDFSKMTKLFPGTKEYDHFQSDT